MGNQCGIGLQKAGSSREGLKDKSGWDNYEIVDVENDAFHINGVERGGSLHFVVKTRLPDGTRSKNLRAAEELGRMVEFFEKEGKPIERICGEWSDMDSSLGDNLNEMNRLLLANPNLSIEDAALGTWTGKQAQKLGYAYPDVIKPQGDRGHYTFIKVYFGKKAHH